MVYHVPSYNPTGKHGAFMRLSFTFGSVWSLIARSFSYLGVPLPGIDGHQKNGSKFLLEMAR